jgi:uncharacterized OsmC-like protein
MRFPGKILRDTLGRPCGTPQGDVSMSVTSPAPQPLVFPVRGGASLAPAPAPASAAGPGTFGFRVDARSLAGMQKEAIVWPQPGGNGWRMLCDEGPYLNGTDLAPFPLGFFAAGLHFCFLDRLVSLAPALGVAIDSLESAQTTRYTMTGSALRGDMTGGAIPAEISVKLRSAAAPEAVVRLIRMAERCSPAQAVMRTVFANTFSLRLNGTPVPAACAASPAGTELADPAQSFASLAPGSATGAPQPLLSKMATARKLEGLEGGVASSLKSEQKRTLQINAQARLLDGGFLECSTQLVSPLGSTFRFISQVERPGEERQAPPPLAYLSAGVAFCFMTQLGRYAQIVKLPLRAYRVVQFSSFRQGGAPPHGAPLAEAGPLDTHLFVDAEIPAEAAARCLQMSEQTCFLHAAMRGSFPTQLAAELNGRPLPLPTAD